MVTKSRNYGYSDVDMLTAALTVTDNAINAKELLIEKRPIWADPFFEELRGRILNAFSEILGVSNAKELALQTALLYDIRQKVLKDVAELKVQINADFAHDSTRRNELLTQLGLEKAGTTLAGYKTSQESLVQLLQRIQSELTTELRTEIEEKGMAPSTLDNILTHADNYLEANVKQETLKGEKRVITDANIQELNEIYTLVSGIAKIIRNFYKGQPSERDKFNISKIVKIMGPRKGRKENQQEENNPMQ